ncbi:hypothetical protein [Pseudodesulfovibrio sp. zrk46]|uniref:hypothetical protein n=1 Tax=Pseudodesulfovibrio sp. zrk46 TaxID=2725288 RepID=UPI001449E83F|nr:hypothetical protein [Pseudodesulfovibrio sp. zrk46]QJB55535.1 hypothetical protein HFN16_03600 [Pseudodesulfovibrio sp. zrk46]
MIATICGVSGFILPNNVRAESALTFAAGQHTIYEYRKFLKPYDGDVTLVEAIPNGALNRCAMDLVIQIKAMRLGGITAPIEFEPVPNARRGTELMAEGHVIGLAQQLNKDTLIVQGYDKKLYVRDAITRFGEFQKGIYCLPHNLNVLAVTSSKELADAGTAIIGLHWNNDAKVLQDMGVRDIIRTPTYESIIKMIGAGRADWAPLEIPNTKDKAITYDGVTLVPVPQIKLSLLESRHYLVSKNHPRGREVFHALQSGLQKLQAQGFIRKALVSCGVINPDTRDWTILNEAAMLAGEVSQ